MARLNFVLADELEQRFRKTVSNRLGMKKGNMQKAIEEAIDDWIKKK
jgi:hypothetical protein